MENAQDESIEQSNGNEAFLIRQIDSEETARLLAPYINEPMLVDAAWGEGQLKEFQQRFAVAKATGSTEPLKIKGTELVRNLFVEEDSEGNLVYVEEQTENSVGIAEIAFDGVMRVNGGYCATGISEVCSSLEQAYRNPKIKGVILKMNTGGGAVDAAEMLRNTINERNKPVYVHARNLMSGGMWGASGADGIYADGTVARFGSIGTYIEFAEYTEERIKQMGYVVHTVYATDSTEKNLEYREAVKGKYALLKNNSLDPINNKFIGIMNNKKGIVQDGAWKHGATYFPEQAIELGLIEGVANSQTIIKEILMKEAQAELKEAIKGVFSAKVEKAADLKAQTEAVKKMNEAMAAADAAAEKASAEIADLTAKIQTANERVAALEAAAATTAAAVEGYVQKIEELGTQVATLGDNLSASKAEAADWQAKYEQQVEYTSEIIEGNGLSVDVSRQATPQGVQGDAGALIEEKVLSEIEQLKEVLEQAGIKPEYVTF